MTCRNPKSLWFLTWRDREVYRNLREAVLLALLADRLSTIWRFPLAATSRGWQAAATSQSPQRREGTRSADRRADPPANGGLLARLDILIDLVADRRGLALDPGGRLAAAEARLVAEALELVPPSGVGGDPGGGADPGGGGDGPLAGPSARDLAAMELLRALAHVVGLLRDRGDRIEATTLRHPWRQLDQGLRAGLVYAAWCHRVPWTEMLDGGAPALTALREGRTRVLRLLFTLPTGVGIDLGGLRDTIAERLHLPSGEWLLRTLAAVFLDPLVALGVAELDPPSPRLPASARLGPRAETVIGSALIAAGEDLPLSRAG
jgi:hypothetical protein